MFIYFNEISNCKQKSPISVVSQRSLHALHIPTPPDPFLRTVSLQFLNSPFSNTNQHDSVRKINLFHPSYMSSDNMITLISCTYTIYYTTNEETVNVGLWINKHHYQYHDVRYALRKT